MSGRAASIVGTWIRNRDVITIQFFSNYIINLILANYIVQITKKATENDELPKLLRGVTTVVAEGFVLLAAALVELLEELDVLQTQHLDARRSNSKY